MLFRSDASIANSGKMTWKATQALAAGPKPHFFSNIAFLKRIDGSGTTPDSPKVVLDTKLATPTWWQPLAIRSDKGGI